VVVLVVEVVDVVVVPVPVEVMVGLYVRLPALKSAWAMIVAEPVPV
jgi:hypothetical protein